MNKFEVGTVFRWDSFPAPRVGPPGIKPRWFIFLGKNDTFSQVVFAHFCTTTTQTQHFAPGGSRQNHDKIKLEKGSSPFDEDCILDCDEPPYTDTLHKLEDEKSIEVKGKLPEQTMRQIYNRLLLSDDYSYAVLRDIHHSFNLAGIGGLKKPKKP